jgi:hypothetical protein
MACGAARLARPMNPAHCCYSKPRAAVRSSHPMRLSRSGAAARSEAQAARQGGERNALGVTVVTCLKA